MKREVKKLIDAYAAKATNALAVEAVKLVANGATYSEAAEKLSITRNTVAGACWRAGVHVGISPEKAKRIAERNRERAFKRWEDWRAAGNSGPLGSG